MSNRSENRYGLGARVLHWLIALHIIGLVGLGWYMVDLTYYDRWYNDSLSLHKALGIVALLLALAFIICNLLRRPPAFVATLRPWERVSAHLVHFTLYAMMLAIPVTGYIISTSAGDAVSLFGWVDVPAVIPRSDALRDLAIQLHYYLAYGAGGLVILHAAAALKHQFLDKDGTLRRML